MYDNKSLHSLLQNFLASRLLKQQLYMNHFQFDQFHLHQAERRSHLLDKSYLVPKKEQLETEHLTSGIKPPPYTLVWDFTPISCVEGVSFSRYFFVCSSHSFNLSFGCSPLIRLTSLPSLK